MMSDRPVFRWATTSVRLLVGTIVAAGFVVGVVTAVSAPWPTIAHRPVAIEATPAATPTVLSCPGSLLALGREATEAGKLSVAARQVVLSGGAEGAAPPQESILTLQGADEEGPSVFTAAPENGVRTDAAASGSAVVAAVDLHGFAVSACHPPLMESWLVGGATTTGTADLILLANPGAVPATVQLTVFGSQGAQSPPGGQDVVVAAQTQIVIPLAGLALGQADPVVRVTASGSPVQASLQASLTKTLVPVGVEQVGAIAGPEAEVVIPGVEVGATPGAAGSSEPTTVLRMLSPAVDATATVTIAEADAADMPISPITVPLTADVPAEVPLTGLAAGRYTVRVSAAAPILAAVRQSAGADADADFAWYSAAPRLSGPSLFAVPAGPAGVLTIANPGSAAAEVTVAATDGGSSQTVAVAPGSSGTVRLAPNTVYRIDGGDADVRAGVSFAGDGALAAFPVWPSDASDPAIRVYP